MIDDRGSKAVVAGLAVGLLGVAAAASFVFLASDHADELRRDRASPSIEDPPHRFDVRDYGERLRIQYRQGAGFQLGDLRVTIDGQVVEVCRGEECSDGVEVRVGDWLSGSCSSGVLRIAVDRARVLQERVGCGS